MDTAANQQGPAVDVEGKIATIKAHMPETYKAIKEKATELGNDAFKLVRRGLRGEANCFWALGRGHVMGTPFSVPGVMPDLASYMVRFGADCLVVWAAPTVPAQQEAQHGAACI